MAKCGHWSHNEFRRQLGAGEAELMHSNWIFQANPAAYDIDGARWDR